MLVLSILVIFANQKMKNMSQRTQTLLFFLTAISMGLLLFAPLAEFSGEFSVWKFDVYRLDSMSKDADMPFSSAYSVLPVLILTIVSMLLAFYVMTGLIRAINIKQFSRLLTIARINTLVIVAWIALVFAYYIPTISHAMQIVYGIAYKWGVFMPLVALLLNIFASFGLKKDLVKIRSANRIR